MNSIGIGMIVTGLVFNLIGSIGMIRLPDIYCRLQASTKCVTMGTSLLLMGVVVVSCAGGHPLQLAARCLLCMLFILITAPTAAHALARGAYSFGSRLWDKSVVNHYEDDFHPPPPSEDTP